MNRKLFSVNLVVATTAIAISTTVSPAQAAFIGGSACTGTSLSLATIINNTCSLEIDGLRLSGFSGQLTPPNTAPVGATPTGAAAPGPPFPNSLSEVLISSASFLFGSGIQISGGFFAPQETYLDLKLEYMIEALNPKSAINSVYLAFNGNKGKSGDGYAEVVETVRDALTGLSVAQIDVNTDNPTASLTATSKEFGPLMKALITKDIFVTGGNNGRASISFVDNLHTTTPIPTPALLPGLAAFGMSLVRKRKQEQAA
jgi:hypothetical protein